VSGAYWRLGVKTVARWELLRWCCRRQLGTDACPVGLVVAGLDCRENESGQCLRCLTCGSESGAGRAVFATATRLAARL
jgi:hypothetical protein